MPQQNVPPSNTQLNKWSSVLVKHLLVVALHLHVTRLGQKPITNHLKRRFMESDFKTD